MPVPERVAVPGATAALKVHVNLRRLGGLRTGIEIYMEQLVRALARTGDVQLVGTSCVPLTGEPLHGVEVAQVGSTAMRSRSTRDQLRKLAFDQWGCLQPSGEGPRLFHGLDGSLPFSLRRRDRAVATIFDFGFALHPELFDARTRLYHRVMAPWVCRRADRFIAISAHTAGDLIRLGGVPADRVHVVHPGVDPFFLETPTSREAGQDERDRGPFVLAVGGVSPRKNTRRLIEAFARWRVRRPGHARHRLLITGQSLDAAAGQGADLGVGVEVLGYVTRERLRALYRSADAFLYPSVYEGFGLPILEAMGCGVPVLTSRRGSAPEVAGGAAVLADPFDVDSIVSGIERVLDPDESAGLRQQGLAHARRFTWDRTAMETVDVYRRLDG